LDTLHAAGLSDYMKQSSSFSIGFLGHSGLLLVSTMIVKTIYKVVFAKKNGEEPEPAGILSRCPWPFIFFHDPKQGLNDSSTWVVITWIVLWRIAKKIMIAKA
jgi:hypothetical protein